MPKSYKGRPVIAVKESRGGWHSRGYFPHFDGVNVTQHVTFHLFDSLPQSMLTGWRIELQSTTEKNLSKEMRKRIQEFLDNGYGSCLLPDPRLAMIVENALLYFDGQRYSLHAWCIMPNHVHALFTPIKEFTTSRVVYSRKSFTAHECNKVLHRTGPLWSREPFDRYIRNNSHFRNALQYIEHNPVKAGLCNKPEDWQWSSAR